MVGCKKRTIETKRDAHKIGKLQCWYDHSLLLVEARMRARRKAQISDIVFRKKRTDHIAGKEKRFCGALTFLGGSLSI
jgi:hypothetical protein